MAELASVFSAKQGFFGLVLVLSLRVKCYSFISKNKG